MNKELLTKMRDVLREEAAGEDGLAKALPSVESPRLDLGCYISLPDEDNNYPHTRFCLAGLAALLSGMSVPEAVSHDTKLHEFAMTELGLSERVANSLFFGGMSLHRWSHPDHCAQVIDNLMESGEVVWDTLT